MRLLRERTRSNQYQLRSQKGQALIEAIFGFALISAIVLLFGHVLLKGVSQLILDHEADRLVMCQAAVKNQSCANRTFAKLKLTAPWLNIQNISSQFRLDATGFGRAEAELVAKTRFSVLFLNVEGDFNWQPISFNSKRFFDEKKMKRVSRY